MAYPKWYVVVPSFVWASSVGYSRMHLGVHYPSDVLVGAMVGSSSAFLTQKANQWLNKKRKKNKI
jgi:membrane-associated phospholipid phosphatase